MTDLRQFEIIKTLKIKNENKRTLLIQNKQNKNKYIIKLFNSNNHFSYIAWLREKCVDFNHANICKLIDYGKLNNDNFIIREYIDGADWNTFYKNVKLNKKEKLKIVIKQTIDVLEALKVLHNNKIVHRDIRPENILIENNKAKLIDFESVKCERLMQIDTYSTYTFFYSAPEQVLKMNEIVNETSDIFSLGMTLWIIFNGKYPYYHKIPEVLANLQVTYPTPITVRIPKPLRPIIEKAIKKYQFSKPPLQVPIKERIEMLQSSQSMRYQTAEEMITDLKNILH